MPAKFYSLWIITESGIILDGFLQIRRERDYPAEVFFCIGKAVVGEGGGDDAAVLLVALTPRIIYD